MSVDPPKMQEIDIHLINSDNKSSVRTYCNDYGGNHGSMEQLLNSIEAHGVINPIVVFEIKDPASGEKRYDLAQGFRRVDACKQLGWKKIIALVYRKS